jgi:putative membrane protein
VSPADWSWSVEALAPLALAAAYLLATRGRREGWRAASFLSGCVLLVVALVTPLDTLARDYLVWAHLLQNVVLAEWAPLLLVLGIPAALGEQIGGAGVVRALTHPFVALPLWVGAYALWHVPAFYDGALRHPDSLLALEHATYLVTGMLFWWCVWQDAPHRLSSAARAAYAFGAFVLSAPLGLVLALVPEPLYDAYADAPERMWGVSRLTDQQLGGMTMAAEQSIVFFAVFAYWFLRFLSEQERVEQEVA